MFCTRPLMRSHEAGQSFTTAGRVCWALSAVFVSAATSSRFRHPALNAMHTADARTNGILTGILMSRHYERPSWLRDASGWRAAEFVERLGQHRGNLGSCLI